MKKINYVLNSIVIVLLTACIAACASHHKGGKNGADGSGSGASGAYAQGIGEGGGYGDVGANCTVPQTPGFKTASFFFDYDKNEVHPQDMSRLQDLAQSISANHAAVRVNGSTDDRGSREYNMALGWRRANAVLALLKQGGVGANGVTANSFGAEKPIAFGTSDQDFQCNRRVDVIYR